MSECDIGFSEAFIVTETLTTLGATFCTIGAKLVPFFTSRTNGLLSSRICNGAFPVSLPLFDPGLKANPMAMCKRCIRTGVNDVPGLNKGASPYRKASPREWIQAILIALAFRLRAFASFKVD
jgi:hypothetical protein